jgi:hypothetical protein
MQNKAICQGCFFRQLFYFQKKSGRIVALKRSFL